LREAARKAILAGEFGRAWELARGAREAQATPAGETLVRLGAWLRA
jgi:hypothetical protein